MTTSYNCIYSANVVNKKKINQMFTIKKRSGIKN